MSSTQAAVVAYTKPPRFQREQIAIPKPGAHQVLVKISHAALNPTDMKSFDAGLLGDHAVYGCDFVGEVVELGADVQRVKKGDVVAALIRGGGEPGLGAFSTYTLAHENICFKVPEGTSRAEASTIPLAADTAWLAMYSSRCLNIERGRPQVPETILIWGGSSSVGQYAIQLAKLEALTVVTVCSPHNFDLMKKLRADFVFDYNDADVVKKIKSVAPELRYVFDTIGNETSSGTAASAIHDKGKLCTVRPGKAFTKSVPESVEVSDVLVWTAFNKDCDYGNGLFWPASQEDHDLSAEFFGNIPLFIQSEKLVPNKPRLLKGLDSVEEGYELIRQGKLSAEKVVYEA